MDAFLPFALQDSQRWREAAQRRAARKRERERVKEAKHRQQAKRQVRRRIWRQIRAHLKAGHTLFHVEGMRDWRNKYEDAAMEQELIAELKQQYPDNVYWERCTWYPEGNSGESPALKSREYLQSLPGEVFPQGETLVMRF